MGQKMNVQSKSQNNYAMSVALNRLIVALTLSRIDPPWAEEETTSRDVPVIPPPDVGNQTLMSALDPVFVCKIGVCNAHDPLLSVELSFAPCASATVLLAAMVLDV